MKLRVVQLGPVPPPEGGVSRNVFAIRERLLREDNECSVIATTKSDQSSDGEGLHFPRNPLDLIKTLRSTNADITHLHLGGDITTRVLALASAAAAFGRGSKVLTMHSGGFPTSREGRMASPTSFAAAIFRQFDHVVAVNDEIADVFLRYGIENDKLTVIPPYTLARPPESVELPKDVAEFADRHSPLLVAVGGLEPEYQPLLQVEAMELIAVEFPRAGLMIVGGGSLRQQAESAIEHSSVKENILLAGGLEHDAVLKMIERSDVLLRTTLFDGDAISVREALFLGTPVIATKTGMRPEGVHILGNSQPQDLANAVNDVLALDVRPAAGLSGEDNIDKVLELYCRLAGKHDS